MIHTVCKSKTKSLVMKFLAIQCCLAALCLASAFSVSRAASMTTPTSTSTPAASPSYTVNNGAFRRPLEQRRRKKRRNTDTNTLGAIKEEEEYEDNSESSDRNNDTNDSSDDDLVAILSKSGASTAVAADTADASTKTSTSASRWNRRKKVALGLVASIATTAGAAKVGWLGGSYTDTMIARDAFMAGLTSVLAVVMNRGITWGYEAGKYDSNIGRKITHILSAPLFIVTWPFFSDASGARFFAGLVTLTNVYRLYLAGTGDAAESSLANTISRSGDKAEALGGPFIYVCLFQCFILAFWRNTFPGVVAMTTMAAGDGMADIIGRRYGKNGYKWPFSDGKKSLVGTLAFCIFSFGLTLGICSWLIATGVLLSVLAVSELATRIFAISCICALVEVLPVGDDNYTVPGSAALLSWLWLR